MKKRHSIPVGGGLASILFLIVGFQLFSVDPKKHLEYQQHILEQRETISSLNEDIIRIRYQTFSSYDSLVSYFHFTRSNLEKLCTLPTFVRGEQKQDLERILRTKIALFKNQKNVIEEFKTKNSLLKNSLRYLPELKAEIIDRLSRSEENITSTQLHFRTLLIEDLETLLQNILLYNLTSERKIALQIEQNLQKISQLKTKQDFEDADAPIDLAIAHVRIILINQTELNKLTEKILSAPIDRMLDDIEISYQESYQNALQRSNLYRLSIYLVSLALIGWISYFIIKQLWTANHEVSEANAELKQTLQELQKTQAQLVQAEKMSGLGKMVGGIAHEINNPMSFIYSNLVPAREYIQNLFALVDAYQEKYPQANGKVRETIEAMDLEFVRTDLPQLLKSMKKGADRVRNIVTTLRNFSRLDESDMKTVDIHQGLESTLLILQNRLTKRQEGLTIEIIKNYGDLPDIECHPSQLNQVFFNLINNAIDAINEAKKCDRVTVGIISIKTMRTEDNCILIAIKDNGIGIPESIKQRIFDPFFTTKPIGSGTGLGLSISYQIIVDKHRGDLQCFSQPEQGTEFQIKIPISYYSTPPQQGITNN